MARPGGSRLDPCGSHPVPRVRTTPANRCQRPGDRGAARLSTLPLALLLLVMPWLTGPGHAQGIAPAEHRPPTWRDIDQLRALLMAHGTRVVQQDCNQRGLQGLYHDRSDTIVICRVHRDPAAVWNTLAHEATHRMQACAGGSITRPANQPAMARALATHEPQEWRSIGLYPREQQLSELEARYTARLPPDLVPRLFRRYCGDSPTSTRSQQL